MVSENVYQWGGALRILSPCLQRKHCVFIVRTVPKPRRNIVWNVYVQLSRSAKYWSCIYIESCLVSYGVELNLVRSVSDRCTVPSLESIACHVRLGFSQYVIPVWRSIWLWASCHCFLGYPHYHWWLSIISSCSTKMLSAASSVADWFVGWNLQDNKNYFVPLADCKLQ